MCLNNFELIKEHISKFENPGDNFWFVQVLTRGKDLKALAKANGEPEPGAANKVIKTWLVRDVEHLEKIRPMIIKLRNIFHARAYISLTKIT